MASSKLYDALIIGSGPAGLSAALSLSRVHRTTAVFTKPNCAGFVNQGSSAMHNVLSRDGLHPAEFRKISKEQLAKYGTVDFIEDLIQSRFATAIRSLDDAPIAAEARSALVIMASACTERAA